MSETAHVPPPKYRNPPLIEAVCEFRFSGQSKWDATIPGRVFERLQEDFPVRASSKAISLATTDAQRVEMQFIDKSVFRRPDGTALVQIAPRLLAVNHLKPYPGWPQFSRVIEKVFASYSEVAGNEGFHRIGLRYINRFELPGELNDLEDLLDVRPFLGKRLTQPFISFIVGVQLPYDDSTDVLKVEITSLATPSYGITIDLDYFLAQPEDLAPADWLAWLTRAHSRLEEAFDACTTEKAKNEIFGRIQ